MKALVSRDSHRPELRYSGVYHVQGAMVTDADLDERSIITRERTDNLGDDAIRDGVPAIGGAVGLDENGGVQLGEGIIYADGVRGVLTAAAGANPAPPLGVFTAQADLPLGPALPATGDLVVYADIWERPVFPLEDPYLADVALHGAVTGFRTRTMTQLKAAPAAAEADIDAGTGAFPQIGTGRLAVTPLNAEILADECDPCADVVSAEQQVANTLWRLEVTSITGTPDNPTGVVIAWSEENAAEIAPATVSAELFERTNKVYEFFSPITESHAGVFAIAAAAKRSAFVDDLATAPVPAQNHDGSDWPFVRRWDGTATIDLAGGTVIGSLGGGFTIEVSGQQIKLTVSAFEAVVDLAGAAVVPGDYWLVELRRYAAESDRVHLVKETPVGILHHYCTLVTVSGGVIEPLTDERWRKLSFPTLSNLPADHVGFDNNCAKLYGDADNVQEALDNLCSISADDIAFESNCPVLFDDAKTVQEALDALCRVDFSVQELFRLLFDWGVLCGMVPTLPKRSGAIVSVSAGAYLDRSGKITKFPKTDIDLGKLELGEEIVFGSMDLFIKALRSGEVCLAVAAGDGGKSTVHLVPESLAYGPADPGFAERVRACSEKKKLILVDDVVAKLPARQKSAADKMFLTLSGDGAFRSTARLTKAEFTDAEAVNAAYVSAFDRLASEDEIAALKDGIQKARDDNPIGNLTGVALEVRQMQQATAVFTAITEADNERLRRCICENLFPACPPDPGKPPYYVPIACVRGLFDGGILLQEVCPYCCRKQAMTWRAVEYFVGDMRERVAARLAAVCCAKEDREPVPTPGLAIDPKRYAAMDIAKFVGDYKLVNAFLDTPETLPSDYVTKVPVNDLSANDAKTTLNNTGIDVVETVDIDDAKAFDMLQSRLTGVKTTDLLLSGSEVRPGDKVALLVQDGVARGYVLVERGSGKLPFEPARAAAFQLSEAEIARAEALTKNATAAREDLANLEKSRDALIADIDGLKAESANIEKERDTVAAALKESKETLDALARTRESLSSDIAVATKELADAESNSRILIESIRNAQPVTAVIGNDNPELVSRLAGEGITTVGDISKLTAATIKRLDRAGILKESEGTELKSKAIEFRTRPIG